MKTLQCSSGCALAGADVTTTVPSTGTVDDGSGPSQFSTSYVYLVFSEYQLASSSTSGDGNCVTEQGLIIALSSQYSISSPPAVDNAAFQYNATTSFIDHLGFSSCTPFYPVPTALVQVSNATLNATPVETYSGANLTPSSSPRHSLTPTSLGTAASSPASAARKGLSPTEKTAVEVVCTGLFVALIGHGIWAWRRYRKRRHTPASDVTNKDPQSSTEDTQPYLQQKPELDAEEAAKHEMHAEEQRYELAEDTIYEMQGGEQNHEILTEARAPMASLTARHELKGEEHSKELEAR